MVYAGFYQFTDIHTHCYCLQVDDYSLEGTLTGPFVFAANMFAFVLVVGAGLNVNRRCALLTGQAWQLKVLS
jgi:hypothetical protein